MTQPSLIPGPVLEIDAFRARRNIDRMVAKARKCGVNLRPHFKTHQSLQVAAWFREAGVNCCTVSSPAMAVLFADGGWHDILIAFPAQPGAVEIYRRVAAKAKLGIVTDSVDVIRHLAVQDGLHMDLWLEIDAGYGRSGALWNDADPLQQLASAAAESPQLHFRGVLTHGGDTYRCRGQQEIRRSFQQTSDHMAHAAAIVSDLLGKEVGISCGDTPACSVMHAFPNMTELRPGNFVYYDLMQYEIGACRLDDIAVCLACPVVGIYPDRGEVVIHGGAVHFSKEQMPEHGYGRVMMEDAQGKRTVMRGAMLHTLSQEHGVIRGPRSWLESLRTGDVLRLLPIHSCLAVDCMLGLSPDTYQSVRVRFS